MLNKFKYLFALLLAFAMVAAACGDSSDTTESGSSDTTAAAEDDAMEEEGDDAMEEGDDAMEEGAHSPGTGIEVTMARANWASGYIQAEIYRQILTELGYTVSNPADLELSPDLGYQQMAEGEIDFWTNSWYPGHFTWHEGERSDGTRIGDNLTVVSGLFEDSGVQGFLATKSWVDENGITSIQQINDDPALIATIDSDGNGAAELYGCPEDWTCDDIITSQIAFYGWENVEQTQAGYDAMFAEALDKANADEPMMIYTWTPSAYVTQMIPGDNVVWLSAHPTDVLDDSNPTGVEGGENHQQGVGFSGFGADTCTQPCQLGWEAADIQVTANKEFADANPDLIKLFEQIRPSVIDISIAQVEQSNGDGSQADVERIATEWIADNRDLVDGWIATAFG